MTSNPIPVRRNLFTQKKTPVDTPFVPHAMAGPSGVSNNDMVPMDLTIVSKSSSAAKACLPHDGENSSEAVAGYVEVSNDANSGNSTAANDFLSSGQILGYENRINSLVSANQTKVRRIKDLLDERAGLLNEIQNAHRINRLLTETVDMYREQDENNPPLNGNHGMRKQQQQSDRHQNDTIALRDRIRDLNRQNFELMEENTKLKEAIGTYSTKVLSEHNYNL